MRDSGAYEALRWQRHENPVGRFPSGKLTVGSGYLANMESLELGIIGASVPQHKIELLDIKVSANLQGIWICFNPDMMGVSAQVVRAYAIQCALKK